MTGEYPKLARKLILISTKSYFTPERTIKYLQDLLELAPKYTHPDLLLLGLIPDFLTIYPPQIESVLLAVPANAPVVFAYEPVWAIGRAQPAPVEYVATVVRQVRELVRVVAPAREEGMTRIVYGGT
ncbi:hypothetical protein DV738_g4822, partial [Chaetothyriales sp. CBS 135597]